MPRSAAWPHRLDRPASRPAAMPIQLVLWRCAPCIDRQLGCRSNALIGRRGWRATGRMMNPDASQALRSRVYQAAALRSRRCGSGRNYQYDGDRSISRSVCARSLASVSCRAEAIARIAFAPGWIRIARAAVVRLILLLRLSTNVVDGSGAVTPPTTRSAGRRPSLGQW